MPFGMKRNSLRRLQAKYGVPKLSKSKVKSASFQASLQVLVRVGLAAQHSTENLVSRSIVFMIEKESIPTVVDLLDQSTLPVVPILMMSKTAKHTVTRKGTRSDYATAFVPRCTCRGIYCKSRFQKTIQR